MLIQQLPNEPRLVDKIIPLPQFAEVFHADWHCLVHTVTTFYLLPFFSL